MIRINQIKILCDVNKAKEPGELRKLLLKKAAKLLRVSEGDISKLHLIRHSIDARKKPEIYDIYMVDIELAHGNDESVVKKCRDKNVSVHKPLVYDFKSQVCKYLEEERTDLGNKDKKIIVIGAGPAGLFCAYMLAENGYKPIVLERGADVDKRIKLVNDFWNGGKLDPCTNVQFGEGGAGTFSDGKLNTLVKDKDGRGRKALEIFVKHGAKDNILYEAKPHIGTDILCGVVKGMREHIIELGGEVLFESQVTDFVVDESGRLIKVVAAGKEYPCDAAVLAIGHSARDTFYTLKERKVEMQKKPFAVGFRVEHPQKLINLSQYGIEDPKGLPAAPYKLVAEASDKRGVYSFCMCPGGYVVNASSEEGRLAVNGMSYNARDSRNANSAIIITISPEDFGGEDVLSGVEFQRKLEEKAYKVGNGSIPVEYYCDFKENVVKKNNLNILLEEKKENTTDRNLPVMKGSYVFSDVHDILPDDLNVAFVEGMEKFGRMIKGYNNGDALVSGVESRTSSPVRIVRDFSGESVNIKGLYPCGEGAGYAGGIMSAAMDGIQTAEHIVANLLK
jgi:uncharacterized FAD-dependent dehydrogenase